MSNMTLSTPMDLLAYAEGHRSRQACTCSIAATAFGLGQVKVSVGTSLTKAIASTLLPAMSSSPWFTLLVGALTLGLATWYFALPLLVHAFGNFSVTRLTPYAARGVEWRLKKDDMLPTVRVERADWRWGGLKADEVGIFVLTIEGVIARVKQADRKQDDQGTRKRAAQKTPGFFSRLVTRAGSWMLHVVIHHYPILARIISIRIVDIRIISDDLGGLECAIEDIQMGAAVQFGGRENHPIAQGVMSPPMSPMENIRSPGSPLLSPPASPLTFTSFVDPFASGLPISPPSSLDDPEPASFSRFARLSQAKRKATQSYVAVTSTASQAFARAIGRARGSISLNVAMSDIAIILPHENEIPAIPPKLEASSSTSMRSLPSLLRKHSSKPARFSTTNEAGYSTLASVKGVSKAKLGLGFRPGKGLLAEDTLTAALNLASVEGTVGGVDKILDLMKKMKATKAEAVEIKAKTDWSATAMPRIVLRALEQASFTIAKASITQRLSRKPSHPNSASSSATDITLAPPFDEDVFALSLDVDGLAIILSAADSSTNNFAKNTFGAEKRPAPESRIRGIGFGIQWDGAAVTCLSPGEAAHDKTQLIAIRRAEIEGLSTWRPNGWSREELLFADDLNISLVIGTGNVASADVTADLQLVDELKEAIGDYVKSRADPTSTTPTPVSDSLVPCLPPRFRLGITIGPMMVAVTDKIEDQRMTVSMSSDGCRLGCFTSYEDIVGRRKPAEQKRIFKEEEELRSRRDEAGHYFNAALPNAMHRPQHRRNPAIKPAVLSDDLSFRLQLDVNSEMQPISVHLNIDQPAGRTESYEMVSVGRLHVAAFGSIAGLTEIASDGSDIPRLDFSTRSINVDLGIEGGIQASLYEAPVIRALVAMGLKRQLPTPPTTPPATTIAQTLLERLPPGIALRLSLGAVSAFIGHPDINPNCKRRLTRGLSLRSAIHIEHAYYTQPSQYPRDRIRNSDPIHRTALHLREDVTAQAIAYSESTRQAGGRAALATVVLSDLSIRPIFNGDKFAQAGGCALAFDEATEWERAKRGKDKAGRREKNQTGETSARASYSSQRKEPSDTGAVPNNSDRHQALRPLLRLSQASINIMLQQDAPDTRTAVKLTGKLSRPVIDGDMSHIYCIFVMQHAISRIAKAWKRPSSPTTPKPIPLFELSASIKIPAFTIHFAFPLREQITLDIGNILVEKPPMSGYKLTAGRMTLYVRSPRHAGMWEELGWIKDLQVLAPVPAAGQVRSVDVEAECFRLRIPYGYKLADIILNINVSIKALNTLRHNFTGGDFWMKHEPRPEEPKRVPNIQVSIKRFAIEAMDDPLESKLKIIFRAGLLAQERRIELEDMMQEKLHLLDDPEGGLPTDGHAGRLSAKATVSMEDARHRLDWQSQREWIKRHEAAVREERTRESEKRTPFYIRNSDNYLDIKIFEHEPAPPLFRILFDGLKLGISSLVWTHDQTVAYMSECSLTPFDKNVQFSLMVPLKLKWTMDALTFTLRDYPLPLVRIRSSNPAVPAWSVETPFIIAEDYHGPDTWFSVPTEIIPADLGESGAATLRIEVHKTITPVKTYTQPLVNIQSDLTSEFAWGNAIQPAIQDMMKIMDTISHPPKDPSDKPGFWDKLRLILQWRIQLDFAGPVHLHYKGAPDPYTITGHGAGFAFAWRHGTTFRIGYPNAQYELIQAESDELMVVIPDLTAAHDGAAVGDTKAPCGNAVADEIEPSGDEFERSITREYTKPCARFVGGIRIGFGFVFERTCRPWNCTVGCGETENLGRRHCRFFDFKKHQDVILRNSEAVESLEHRAGHTVDSFDGFRSDYIHFSISCVSTKSETPAEEATGPAETSSLHFSPKASAHFIAWWHTFNSALSLPIRKGKLFPNSPPPSKKFGRHLGTIKYRMDLSDVYVSHVYNQVVQNLWELGKSQYLGLKGHFGRVQADAHQRLQERIIRHEKLNRIQVLPHKVFYAADILLDDVVAKGVIAEFVEAKFAPPKDAAAHIAAEEPADLTYVSELPDDKKAWYNFFDYIDSDRKPFDHNPKFQVVDLADCPQLSYGKRSRAHAIDSRDDDSDYSLETSDLETTKFGHEETHICNLGGAPAVAAVQIKLADVRMAELLRTLVDIQKGTEVKYKLSEKDCKARIKSIQKYIDHLRCKEDRHMDGETLQSPHPIYGHGCAYEEEDDFFKNQVYVHSPRIVFTNTTRKLSERYFYSRQDRLQEERMVSNTALREVRRGISRIRYEEFLERANPKPQTEPQNPALDLLREIENLLAASSGNSRLFRLPSDIGAISGDRRLASMGIPVDSTLIATTNVTLFKPQIVLRSEVDADSIVLLAVEEIAFRGYVVNDVASEHRPAEEILSRNYVFFKGLQAFYPTEENVRRSRAEAGTTHSLGFLPLEIFLDDKNEASDYHRIVSKTDAGISVDMFNRLRLPRGVEWPDARDDNNMPIEHLRIHQDLFNVVLPLMTVSGTSKHYAALYNIATDLLLYQDPRHAERSKRIDSFLLAFDRKDRDPVQTILDLFHQQQSTVKLNDQLHWFEAHVDELTNEDKCELFALRNELLEHMEQLFTIFDAIAIATKREKARASQVHSSRVNIMAGGIAWKMQLDDLMPLVQLDIAETIFSYISNKDGSTDQALRINDLLALNSNPDAHFTEVFTRLDVGGTKKGELRKPFVSASWSAANPVGGIPIVKEFRVFLHPIRIALEERIAHQIVDYIFPSRAERHGRGKEKGKKRRTKGKGSPDRGKGEISASSSTLELPPLVRSRSAVSVSSMATGHDRTKGDEKFTLVSSEDADIMRERAAAKNYHLIEVLATVISLSYKSDSTRKSKNTLSRVPDCADLRVRTPALRIANRILTASDGFDLLKTAFVKDVWSQSGSLIGQLFYKTSWGSTERSREKRYKNLHTDIPAKLLGSSKLTYEVAYPSPDSDSKEDQPGHNESNNPLMRVLSRKSPRVTTNFHTNGNGNGNGGDSSTSPSLANGLRRLSIGRDTAMRDLQNSSQMRGDGQGVRVRRGSDEGEEELQEDEGSGGDDTESRVGRVKGFLGRLGRKREHHRNTSVDDLHSSPPQASGDRRAHRSASSASTMSFPVFH